MTDSTRAAFEDWCARRWRGDRGAFTRKHDNSGYIMERLDFALDAYQAARQSALEEARQRCEDIADEYDRTEGGKWPELKSDAKTGASECESAIRQLAAEADKRPEGEKT